MANRTYEKIIVIFFIFAGCCKKTLSENLVRAIQTGKTSSVQTALLKNPNARDFYGKTVLMHVANQGNCDLVKLLIKHGADINATDNAGFTALSSVVYNTYPKEGKSTIKMVRLLVSLGANIDIPHKNTGDTALMWAIEWYDIEIIKFLLKSGASLKQPMENAMSPLEKAVFKNELELVQLFMMHGANPKEQNKNGSSILMFAVVWGVSINILQHLIEQGADVNTADNCGVTALMIAAEKNDLKTVKFLLDRGANKNAKIKKHKEKKYIGARAFDLATDKNVKQLLKVNIL